METLDYYFTHRVTTSDSSGAVGAWKITPDHRYAITALDGSVIGGRWEVKDGRFNIQFDGAPEASSVPHMPGKRPGDTWTVTNTEGQPITITIHAD